TPAAVNSSWARLCTANQSRVDVRMLLASPGGWAQPAPLHRMQRAKGACRHPAEAGTRVAELAGGLEPPTTCLQDRCATDCATPAGPERGRTGAAGILAAVPVRHRVRSPQRTLRLR